MSAADNKKLLQDVFAAWAGGDGTAFFKTLAEDVRWTVIGTSPVSRTFTSRKEFLEGAVNLLTAKLAGSVKPTLLNIIAEGDAAVVQWQGQAPTKAGGTYRNSYCWVMRLENGKVKEGTAYIDTEAVTKLAQSYCGFPLHEGNMDAWEESRRAVLWCRPLACPQPGRLHHNQPTLCAMVNRYKCCRGQCRQIYSHVPYCNLVIRIYP